MRVCLFLACLLMIGFSIAKGGRIPSNLVLLMGAGLLALLLFGCAP